MVTNYSAEEIHHNVEHGKRCSETYTLATDYAAIEAERDELRRRCERMLKMLEPGEEPAKPLGSTDWAFSNYSIVRKLWMAKSDFHTRALAIAEGRDNG